MKIIFKKAKLVEANDNDFGAINFKFQAVLSADDYLKLDGYGVKCFLKNGITTFYTSSFKANVSIGDYVDGELNSKNVTSNSFKTGLQEKTYFNLGTHKVSTSKTGKVTVKFSQKELDKKKKDLEIKKRDAEYARKFREKEAEKMNQFISFSDAESALNQHENSSLNYAQKQEVLSFFKENKVIKADLLREVNSIHKLKLKVAKNLFKKLFA